MLFPLGLLLPGGIIPGRLAAFVPFPLSLVLLRSLIAVRNDREAEIPFRIFVIYFRIFHAREFAFWLIRYLLFRDLGMRVWFTFMLFFFSPKNKSKIYSANSCLITL